jgi:predicted ester cyclase
MGNQDEDSERNQIPRGAAMAFVIRVNPTPAMTAEAYEQVGMRLEQAGAGNPPGLIYHTCYGTRDDLHVFDVWDNREDFDRFSATIVPILQELGFSSGPPEMYELHDSAMGSAAKSTAAMSSAMPASRMGLDGIHRAAHAAFNGRDLHEAVRHFRPDTEYTDHARGLTTKGPAEFIDWMQGWIDAFPDATVEEARYIDSGDHCVATFQGRGTNNGPMGNLPPTGHRMDIGMCEVLRFDSSGRIAGGDMYYDTMSIMVQLGHMQPPMTGSV